jgi:hypothetical protein
MDIAQALFTRNERTAIGWSDRADIAAALAAAGRASAEEMRERCAQHIEALAIAIRDNGPKSAEGLLTAIAGAQVGVLFDAADSLRNASPASSKDRELCALGGREK